MGMFLTCSNKGCGFSDDHRLDEASNEVICSKCAKPINVSVYAKKNLKNFGQIVKKVKSDFEMNCEKCGAIDSPMLKRFGRQVTKVICNQCHEINAHLTKYFVEALKLKPGIVTIDATPEEIAASGVANSSSRFNKVMAPKINISPEETIIISPPNEESLSKLEGDVPSNLPIEAEVPTKVEYYHHAEKDGVQAVEIGNGSVVISPSSEEPINVNLVNVVDATDTEIKTKKTPKNTLANESILRKNIENSAGLPTIHAKVPPPPGLNLSDFANTGVLDYAGDVED